MPAYLDDLDTQSARFPYYRDEEDYLDPPDLGLTGAPAPDAFLAAPSKPDLFGTVIPQANPTNPRVKSAYDAVQAVDAQRPVRQKPGFWRSLAAIGVGLGAGYSNSTGKFAPLNVSKDVDAVRNGPYNQKMADWQQKQADTLQTLKAAQEADKGEQDYLSEPVKRDYLGAEAEHMRANVDKIHHDIASEKARDRYLTLKDGSVYDTHTQSTIWKPRTPPDERLAFAQQQGWDPKDPAIQGWIMDGKSPADGKPDRMQLVEGADGFHVVDVVTGKQTQVAGIPPRPRTDPLATLAVTSAHQDARDIRKETVDIEERKGARLTKAVDEWKKSLKGPSDLTRQPTAADLEALRRRKQEVQNAYESELKSATGQPVDHFEYPPEGGGAAPRASTPPPGSAPTNPYR